MHETEVQIGNSCLEAVRRSELAPSVACFSPVAGQACTRPLLVRDRGNFTFAAMPLWQLLQED